jgi:hypothetical protein
MVLQTEMVCSCSCAAVEVLAIESRSRGMSYMKYVNGRRTGLVTFCIETALYNGLFKERYKGG